MKILKKLTYFEKDSDAFVGEIELPNQITFSVLKKILDDDELHGCFPVDEEIKNRLNLLIDYPIDLDKYDYFIEFSGDYTLDLSQCEHREIMPINEEEAEEMLKSGGISAMRFALKRIAANKNWRWAQDKCLEYIDYDENDIRVAVIQSLGDIARAHKQLDLEKVLPILEKLKNHNDSYVSSAVSDTLTDIEDCVVRKRNSSRFDTTNS